MNIAKMDLNLLVVFDALMHERNVTRAARRLFLSQPAVSHALQRLRDSLNDPLFVRAGRDMAPTPRAEALAPVVRPLLEGLTHALYGGQFSPATLEQTFRIGTPDIGEFVLVPRLLPMMQLQAPLSTLAVMDLDIDIFQQQLVTGELDAAIVPDMPLRPGMYKKHMVNEARVVGVVRRGHPLADKRITLADMRKVKRVAVTLRAGRISSPVELSLAQQQDLGEVAVSTPHFVASAATLMTSDLMLIVGELAAAALANQFDLELVELPVELPGVQACLIWHERTQRDPAQRWFRETIGAALSPGKEPSAIVETAAKARKKAKV